MCCLPRMKCKLLTWRLSIKTTMLAAFSTCIQLSELPGSGCQEGDSMPQCCQKATELSPMKKLFFPFIDSFR